MSESKKSIKIKVSSEVARIVGPSAPRELKLSVARGASSLGSEDQITALFSLYQGSDAEIKTAALSTLRSLPSESLQPLAADPLTHPQMLNFLLRLKVDDPEVARTLVDNPSLPHSALLFAASRCTREVLGHLAGKEALVEQVDRFKETLLENPNADMDIKTMLGIIGPPAVELSEESAVGQNEIEEVSDEPDASDGQPEDLGDAEDEEKAEEAPEYLSKVKIASELGISEKIKMALTGDKEWRRIFLKDTNKLVCAAAIKNPRITDGEVLAVAKNKSSNDELIRLICMNREWVKNYEIKKALVVHPKTPLPKALRFMEILGNRDLKHLAKSRGISPILVNNARRMLLAKEKKA